MENQKIPDRIEVRGGRVHNLKHIDVDIPLNKIVGIAGLRSGSCTRRVPGVIWNPCQRIRAEG